MLAIGHFPSQDSRKIALEIAPEKIAGE